MVVVTAAPLVAARETVVNRRRQGASTTDEGGGNMIRFPLQLSSVLQPHRHNNKHGERNKPRRGMGMRKSHSMSLLSSSLRSDCGDCDTTEEFTTSSTTSSLSSFSLDDSSEDVSSLSIPEQPATPPAPPRRTVHFQLSANKYAASNLILSKEEIRALWWRKSDFKAFKRIFQELHDAAKKATTITAAKDGCNAEDLEKAVDVLDHGAAPSNPNSNSNSSSSSSCSSNNNKCTQQQRQPQARVTESTTGGVVAAPVQDEFRFHPAYSAVRRAATRMVVRVQCKFTVGMSPETRQQVIAATAAVLSKQATLQAGAQGMADAQTAQQIWQTKEPLLDVQHDSPLPPRRESTTTTKTSRKQVSFDESGIRYVDPPHVLTKRLADLVWWSPEEIRAIQEAYLSTRRAADLCSRLDALMDVYYGSPSDASKTSTTTTTTAATTTTRDRRGGRKLKRSKSLNSTSTSSRKSTTATTNQLTLAEIVLKGRNVAWN